MDTRTDWLATLLQNSDSLFPTGAYAHSSGLEEVVRLGVVTNEKSLKAFLQHLLMPAQEHLELPYVRFAHEAGSSEDFDALGLIAREIGAWKLGRETREASLQIGRGRLQAARKSFPHSQLEALASSSIPSHQIIVYGWQMAALQIPLEPALTGYFYQALAGTCSAALKLIRIGQEGVQRVLGECLADSDAVVSRSLKIERNDAGWFGPLLEIAAMRHERAAERLFIS